MLKKKFNWQSIFVVISMLLASYGIYKFVTQDRRMGRYYPNSEVFESRGDFDNLGKPTGSHSHYYENGKLFYETEYKRGKRNGKLKRWDKEGQLILMETYSNGNLDGEVKEWDKEGQLILYEIYRNNAIQSKLK